MFDFIRKSPEQKKLFFNLLWGHLKIPKWLWIIPVEIIIYICLDKSDESKSIVLLSSIFQIAGSLAILSTLNNNLKVLSGKDCRRCFVLWFKGFLELFKGNKANLSSSSPLPKVKATFDKPEIPDFKSTEEVITYLISEVQRLEKRINDEKTSLLSKLKGLEETNIKQHHEIKNHLSSLGDRLKDITVGDIKLEAAGIFSVVWGLVIPHFG